MGPDDIRVQAAREAGQAQADQIITAMGHGTADLASVIVRVDRQHDRLRREAQHAEEESIRLHAAADTIVGWLDEHAPEQTDQTESGS